MDIKPEEYARLQKAIDEAKPDTFVVHEYFQEEWLKELTSIESGEYFNKMQALIDSQDELRSEYINHAARNVSRKSLLKELYAQLASLNPRKDELSIYENEINALKRILMNIDNPHLVLLKEYVELCFKIYHGELISTLKIDSLMHFSEKLQNKRTLVNEKE